MVARLEMYDENLEEWVAEADIQPGRSKLLYDRKPINDDVYIIESYDTYTILLKIAEPLIIDRDDKIIILKDLIGDDIVGEVRTGDMPLEFEVEMALDEPLTRFRLSHI